MINYKVIVDVALSVICSFNCAAIIKMIEGKQHNEHTEKQVLAGCRFSSEEQDFLEHRYDCTSLLIKCFIHKATSHEN